MLRQGERVKFWTYLEPGPGFPTQKAEGPFEGVMMDSQTDELSELRVMCTDSALLDRIDNMNRENGLSPDDLLMGRGTFYISVDSDEKAEDGDERVVSIEPPQGCLKLDLEEVKLLTDLLNQTRHMDVDLRDEIVARGVFNRLQTVAAKMKAGGCC